MQCRLGVLPLWAICLALAAISAYGQEETAGGNDARHRPPPPGTVEMKGLDAQIPAGGTVQMQQRLTQPRPVASGGTGGRLVGDINGVSVYSPLGDTAAVGVVHTGFLSLNFISPLSDLGTSEYPIITVTMNVPSTAVARSTYSMGISGTLQTSSGLLTILDKPGTLTIGGSLSVSGIYPGGGTWPAGTVITIAGSGFQPKTRISTPLKTCNPTYISPTQMTIELHQAATLDNQPFQLKNPDGSQVTFYSYLRSVFVQAPTRALLTQTEPVFQQLTRTSANIGPIPALPATQFIGVALQNPSQNYVTVTLQRQNDGFTNTIVLSPFSKVMDTLSVLLGNTVSAGETVTITAPSGIQVLGLYGDDNAGTVMPFLP
jgi:hypothetical protein